VTYNPHDRTFRVTFRKGKQEGWFKALHVTIDDKPDSYVTYHVTPSGLASAEVTPAK